MASAPSRIPSAAATAGFRDGFGTRQYISDPQSKQTFEILALRRELTAATGFEFGLRERVNRLVGFRHANYGRVRAVDRSKGVDPALLLVSDYVPGARLSEIFGILERRRLKLDLSAAVCLIRQLVPTVAALHQYASDVAHGALAAERIVITPDGRLVVVEYACGAAIEKLGFPTERYWKQLRVALPALLPRCDQRADITQVGVIALSLILGRRLTDNEYPGSLNELMGAAWASAESIDGEPMPAGLRGWLARALQLDSRESFSSAIDAVAELDAVCHDIDEVAGSLSLETFLVQYQELAGSAAVKSSQARVDTPPPVASAAPVLAEETTTPVKWGIAAPSSSTSTVPSAPIASSTSTVPSAPIASSTPIVPSASIVSSTPGVVRAPAASSAPAVLSLPIAPSASSTPTIPSPSASVAEPPLVDSPTLKAEPPAISKPDLRPALSAGIANGGRLNHDKHLMVAGIVAAVVLVSGGGLAARRYLSPSAVASGSGRLVVTTNVPGAAVTIDGRPQGVTPVTLTVAAGVHTLELRGIGSSRTIPITVAAGSDTAQYIELPKSDLIGGHLQVRTNPSGANVTVDGMPRGVSPVTVDGLLPGPHTVAVANDVTSVSQDVTIEAGTTSSLVVPLAIPKGALGPGWISVSAPAEVQLLEGGHLLGTSRSDRIMVASGQHEIEIAADALGYRTTRTVEVTPGKMSPIKIEWPKNSLSVNALPWANVSIDGERVGETPIGNVSLAIGTHEVIFRHPELGEQRRQVTVTLTAPARLSVDMRTKQ